MSPPVFFFTSTLSPITPLVVAKDLCEKAANRGCHQLDSAELGHVRVDVGRVESLLGDVQIQQLHQLSRDFQHDGLSQFVFAKQFDISFDRAGSWIGRIAISFKNLARASRHFVELETSESLESPSCFCHMRRPVLVHHRLVPRTAVCSIGKILHRNMFL